MFPLMAASAGMDVLGGLFSYLDSEGAGDIANSRANMIRAESEIDAQRYAEEAQRFKSTQKLSYIKSGVELSGSPLDILDETARTARENISAIRARGEARAVDIEARMKGRGALIGSILGGASKVGMGLYGAQKNLDTASTPRDNTQIPASSRNAGRKYDR